MKSIGLIIFVFGILGATYFALQNTQNSHGFQEEEFKRLWSQDIKQLEESGRLPAGWSDLHNVEVTVTSPALKPWLDKYSPDFPVKPTGKYKLQIFLDDIQDNGSTAVMIQYHLIDLISQDTIWELGRTLVL